MRNADDYLAWIKSVIALCPVVVDLSLIREETLADRGLWRYRLTLSDESLLELFEFFTIKFDKINAIKYSFHWQTKDGQLIKRWDNAAHHHEIITYPHHLHDGIKNLVFPHEPVDIQEILSMISAQITSS
ncbi:MULTISPECIES: DUF6516 family protein [unclassified Synechocystis]|uniref:toxin-antitoxin system TumE family protein n=1 Tax=unclassified Synechocystis TaxID=2640012 RepID=UPI0004198BE4|nr:MULTISPECIES: DUF6516 family protein [unclassified Synechocystis]AIE73557.1 hypothetical protein D082_10290 [Synechocystis sp. PCC 6714]MCT0254108.1 hypothetical protein [Synechocystis sp. CS-94]